MAKQTKQNNRDNEQLQVFVSHLLQDVNALDRMLQQDWFEKDQMKVGAEQELCFIDKNYRPASVNTDVLEKANNPLFTTELARFNAEINLEPHDFKGNALSDMENQLNRLVEEMRGVAGDFGADVILTGILPTIRKFDLSMDNITPMERYYALCNAINKLRGDVYELKVRGVDELVMKHDSPLLEACNTGFQVHLQVSPDAFVQMYNIAQAITGPVMAAAVNSPLLLGKRLWKETRTALFQQTIDTRSTSDHLREESPRVTFGNDWLHESILEIYREDIVRYRVLLSTEVTEDVFHKIESGEAPELMALQVHNSTVYRWNRPCYGIKDGKAHLRIENRVLPSGPSVVDEVANAAFWLGLMKGMQEEVGDVTQRMEFEHARRNFINASQNGLDTKLNWFDGERVAPAELILERLLPTAEKGLKEAGIDEADSEKYLRIIEERVGAGLTGSQWLLEGFGKLHKKTTKDEVLSTLTAAVVENQRKGLPLKEWELPEDVEALGLNPSSLLVEEFMTTDLATVQPNDIPVLVSEILDWQDLQYIPVEDEEGHLLGLISSKRMLREYSRALNNQEAIPGTVGEIMIQPPVTLDPETTIVKAMDAMHEHHIGCLPVVKGEKLVGLITDQNFLKITRRLLNRFAYSK